MDSIPLPYVRIWCHKNKSWVGFQNTLGDIYRLDGRGVYLTLANQELSLVNARLIFPIIDRYPAITAESLAVPAGTRITLTAYPLEGNGPSKRITFEQIKEEVESYLSLITHLPPIQYYVGVRLYESGMVGLPHINRVANALQPGTTLGTEILRERMINWEDMLAICMDVPRAGSQLHVPPPAEYELVGEILVSLGRVTRTQLQKALNLKRGGDKPLGELLLQMGACSKMDIENCLRAQQKIMATLQDRVGLLGELLVQHGVVTYDDLEQALRMQRIGRQPLHAVLVSMGVCSEEQIEQFKFRHPQYVTVDGLDERALASYLSYHQMVSEKQLEEARRIQSRGRLMLGELLVQMQKCRQEDIDRVIGTQQVMRKEVEKAPKKFGEILVHHNVVPPSKVEEAAKKQEQSRQKMGLTLLNLGTCSQDDFTDALELQFSWRQTKNESHDRLGTELLQRGDVSESNLQRALDIQAKAQKPLGQILVEAGACTPESVIDTLISRELRRRENFEKFIHENAATPANSAVGVQSTPAAGSAAEPRGAGEDKGAGGSIVTKISSWFKKS
jgi:hypothetical protein